MIRFVKNAVRLLLTVLHLGNCFTHPTVCLTAPEIYKETQVFPKLNALTNHSRPVLDIQILMPRVNNLRNNGILPYGIQDGGSNDVITNKNRIGIMKSKLWYRAATGKYVKYQYILTLYRLSLSLHCFCAISRKSFRSP